MALAHRLAEDRVPPPLREACPTCGRLTDGERVQNAAPARGVVPRPTEAPVYAFRCMGPHKGKDRVSSGPMLWYRSALPS